MRCVHQHEGRFLLATFTLILGEVVGFAGGDFSPAWPWLVGVWGIFSLAAWGWNLRHWFFPGLFVLGIVLAWRVEAQLRQVLDADAGVSGPRALMELEVDSEPRVLRPMKGGGHVIDFLSHLGPLPLKVIVPLGTDVSPPRIGETWSLDGRLSRARADARRFDRRTCTLRQNATAKRMVERSRKLVKAAWQRLADGLSVDLGLGLDWSPELANLNRAILLGRRSDLPYERKQIFVDAGTIHVFAISGLHVMVVAWMLMEVLGYLGLSSASRALVALPLVVVYVILTGARPSAIRAAMMTGFVFLASAFGQRPNGLVAWSLTALVVYALDPRSVYDLGCALSFVVMFGIVLWIRWVRPFADPHPGPNWRGRLSRFLYGLGISFAAWLAGVPITASAFGRFTPGGLLANIVVIFVAGYMVRSGAGALATMFLCFPLAAVLNNVAALGTWLMATVSERVASLPFSSYEIEPWSITVCCAWYGFWLVFFWLLGRCLPRLLHGQRKWW